MTGIFIVAAKRTPFGAFGGALKNLTATQLGVAASRAAIESAKIDPSIIDSSQWGMVIPTASDGAYLARHVGLKVGMKVSTPALTINRLCGSGFQSIVGACQEIKVGDSSVVLTGGAENMSMAPYVLRTRFGAALGQTPQMEDSLWDTLTDKHAGCPMAITAENLAEKYGITRQECDAYALRSQQTWAAAQKAGKFTEETAPIEVKGKKGKEMMTTDEHPRPASTIESLAKLPSIFKKDGTVTAGNASGIADGAGAVIVASEAAVKQNGLKPLARIAAYAVAGVDPTLMGIGPVPAIQAVLAKAGVKLADVGHVEINEAFAAQYLACEKALGLDRNVSNINGGAIALGHPVGASGARIIAHLVHALQAGTHKYAIGSACIGGGQGIAILLEKC